MSKQILDCPYLASRSYKNSLIFVTQMTITTNYWRFESVCIVGELVIVGGSCRKHCVIITFFCFYLYQVMFENKDHSHLPKLLPLSFNKQLAGSRRPSFDRIKERKLSCQRCCSKGGFKREYLCLESLLGFHT